MKVFKEEQRFTQWWLWLGIISLGMCFIFGTIQQIFFNIPFGNNPMSNSGLILFLLFYIIFAVIFGLLKLETKINETGIYYRFYPIHIKFKSIKWEKVKVTQVIKYRPIFNYGGWGIKHGSFTVKGNIGIQLTLINGKKILIGTQKKIEATQVLETYKKIKR